MPPADPPVPSFLTDGGETGALIAAFDWANTPLGPIERWPQSLKTALGLLLRSPVPIVMLWGPDGIMLYNDGYSGFAGNRHPGLLGSKVLEGWPEAAELNARVMETGMAGGTLEYRDLELSLNRYGKFEPVFIDVFYSPVIDESGTPGGVIAIVIETTERILSERRAAFLTSLAERLRALADPREIAQATADMIGAQLGVDCAGYGEVTDGDDGRVVTIRDAWHAPGAHSIVGEYHLDRYATSFMADFEAGRSVVFDDVANDPRTADTPEGARIRALEIQAQVIVPLVRDGVLAAMLFVHSAQPRAWPAEDIATIRAAAERTWSELARARAEQALRRGEERMRLALVAGGFSDWYWNAATDRIRFSPRAAANLGIPPTFEPSSKDIAAAVIEEDRAATLAAGEKALEDGEPYLIEYRMMRPTGELAWIATYGQPVRGDDGNVHGVIGISQEITARKQADEALREREQQLSAFVTQTTAGLAQVDLTGRFTLVNDRFCEITGYTREALFERTMQSITHADDLPRNIPLFERAVAEGTPYTHEKRYLRPDGSIVWVNNSVAVIRRASGEPYGVLAVTLDVTERRRAEEALRKSEESIRLAIEGAGMAAWEMDLETMIGIWSSNRFDILGYPRPTDRRGTVEQWLDRIHVEDRAMVAAATERCFTEGTPFTLEYRIHRADNGEERWLHSYGNRIDGRAGEPARFVGVSFDITGQKRAEQHQRLLINELNHRVKNTLAIVQAISHQSFAGEGLSRDARHAFEGRLAALSAAHNLLTDQNWEGASLHQVIGDGMAAYHAGERVTIHGPDLPLAPKTSVSLAMAVHELATNATKYGSLSQPGGRIDINWEVADDRLRLVWRESGGPPVSVPARRGFGSRMIERGLAAELGGTVRIDFAPAGLVCTVEAPLPRGGDI
jgi:PAS domain S-box-containing protein